MRRNILRGGADKSGRAHRRITDCVIYSRLHELNDHIDDMLMYLGELYQTDERFVEYINRFATWNVAEFFGEAIKVYCCNR